MNIHYSQTFVLRKDFFENNLHTLTKLPFYTGPKDMEDPVGERKRPAISKQASFSTTLSRSYIVFALEYSFSLEIFPRITQKKHSVYLRVVYLTLEKS